MAMVLTEEGAGVLWNQILQISSIGNPIVHLYGSAYSPVHTDTYATYAALELDTVHGYSPIAYTLPAAVQSVTPIGAGAQATLVTVSWNFSFAYTIYGYWISDQTNTYSIVAEEFGEVYTWSPGAWMFYFSFPPWLASQPSIGGIPCP